MTAPTNDKLISTYLKMRNVIAAKEKAFKAEKKSIEGSMELIGAELRKRLKPEGEKAIKTDSGTAFEVKKEFVGVEDFDDFLKFLIGSILRCATNDYMDEDINAALQNAELQYLNKVVNKTAVLDHMKETKGELPPGIKYSSEIQIQVRK